MPEFMQPDSFREASAKIPGNFRVQIGTFRVTEPMTVRELYETAAWHTDIEVLPGEYPIYVGVGHFEGSFPYVAFTSKVTSCYLASRVGAHYLPNTEGEARVGRTQTVTRQHYWYDLEANPNATIDRSQIASVHGTKVQPVRPSTDGITLPISTEPRHKPYHGRVTGAQVSIINRGSPNEFASITVALAENPYNLRFAEFPFKFVGTEGVEAANRLAARINAAGQISAPLWHLTSREY